MLDQTLAENITDGDTVVFEKGTKITKANLDELKDVLAQGFGLQEVTINEELDEYNKVQVVKIYDPSDKKKIISVIGNDHSIDGKS